MYVPNLNLMSDSNSENMNKKLIAEYMKMSNEREKQI